MQPKPKKLLDRVRDAIRVKHDAYRTEHTYVDSGAHWARAVHPFSPQIYTHVLNKGPFGVRSPLD